MTGREPVATGFIASSEALLYWIRGGVQKVSMQFYPPYLGGLVYLCSLGFGFVETGPNPSRVDLKL